MRLLLIASALLLVSACHKDSQVSTPADAGSQKASIHGSALPFEAGKLPKIEDLKVEDLSKFLVSHEWCTRAAGGSRYTFTQQGTWSLKAASGETNGSGTWTLLSGWLVLAGADGGSRRVDVQTGKVNDRVVVSFDGILYGACEQNAP